MAFMSRKSREALAASTEWIKSKTMTQVLGHMDRVGFLKIREESDFIPRKSKNTRYLTIDTLGKTTPPVFSIIATGDLWFDKIAKTGGTGIIDLVGHMFRTSFPRSVRIIIDSYRS